jgi:hypothetical protein
LGAAAEAGTAGRVTLIGTACSSGEPSGWISAIGCCRSSCWPLARAAVPANRTRTRHAVGM